MILTKYKQVEVGLVELMEDIRDYTVEAEKQGRRHLTTDELASVTRKVMNDTLLSLYKPSEK